MLYMYNAKRDIFVTRKIFRNLIISVSDFHMNSHMSFEVLLCTIVHSKFQLMYNKDN